MITRATRRLPGFRFEVQTPTPTEILPRMDVAVFVGFAASGPLNRPVAVEDIAHFESIFGTDAPLAWDKTRGEMVYAYLAPAVRAFFRNGGRRCWIIRVAGKAQSNYFAIPGLMRAEFDASGNLKRLTPAFAQARSEGSWSESLHVSAALLSDPVVVNAVSTNPLQINLTLNSPDDLVVGDLLRLTFRDEGYQLIFAVDSVKPVTPSPPGAGMMVTVKGTKAIWLQASWTKAPVSGAAVMRTFTHDAMSGVIAAAVPLRQDTVAASPPSSPFDWATSEQDSTVKLNLTEALADAPEPGSLLRVNFGADELWLCVRELRAGDDTGSPPESGVQVIGEAWWSLANAPSIAASSTPDGEVLTFELWARQGEASLLRLSSLGFEARHSLFWGALPTDLQLYPEIGASPEKSRANLWQAAADPRFPLAGSDEANVVYFPLAMPLIPDTFLGPDLVDSTALERDGLGQFDALLFLDDALTEAGSLGLIATADFVRYQSPAPRPLCGIHAALGVEEATIIAVPDAVQRGWLQATVQPPPAPPVSPPLPRPAWWHYLDCQPNPIQTPPRAPQSKSFPQAKPDSVFAPKLERNDLPDEPGVLILTWSMLTQADANYALQEATQPDFGDASTIYVGKEQKMLIYGRLPGDYYYHVRAIVNGLSSDWSNGIVVRVPTGSSPLVAKPQWGNFLDCDIVIIQPPVLAKSDPNANGTFTLEWTSVYGATYILEEATTRDFDGSVVIYSGVEERRMVYGRSEGDYYYRVRAVVNGTSSDWSNGVPVRVSLPMRWLLNPMSQYSPNTLLAVQRALLRMCAARGDLFAVLAIPEHYREDATIAHVAALTSSTLDFVGADDARTFSFGGLYHPWLIGREDPSTAFRRMPPDGAACGILARRALARGAWVAPANELFDGIVALTPSIEPERRLDLQDAHINLIRQEPRGFLVLDADTLSHDDDVRPINVRRLLMLLRRLALKLGATYVFEPNDDSFRRMVTRGFEAMLGEMFTRGAFAGNTPATSFQVVTDSSVNTPQSVEQGRFIVELRVAPSLPMTFLTIRLVQTGDRTSVTEVR